MTTTATGNFDLTPEQHPPYDEADGVVLARVSIPKQWRGDIEGTSTLEMITAMGPVTASAGYVGVERITGALHGKKGSFVIQHSALMRRGEGELIITVVPDSGTGELAGLSGTMTIDPSRDHYFELEYDFKP